MYMRSVATMQLQRRSLSGVNSVINTDDERQCVAEGNLCIFILSTVASCIMRRCSFSLSIHLKAVEIHSCDVRTTYNSFIRFHALDKNTVISSLQRPLRAGMRPCASSPCPRDPQKTLETLVSSMCLSIEQRPRVWRTPKACNIAGIKPTVT